MSETYPLQPCQRFANGRFVLVRALGRGGMGEVWLAQDERLQEQVALKFLPPAIRGDATALHDLRRETARSHKLTHPNIVRIHDLHEEMDGTAFIIMEYVDGPTLSSLRLRHEHGVLTWDYLKPLLEQLCAALDYAHSEKVIHRDLKPANLMVDSRKRLKLADFGIAATVSDSMSRVSAQQTTSGTLLYMSPQQLAGKRSQVTDDIYALGATLYELLTSQPPFVSGDLTHQILHEPPEPMAERLAALTIQNNIPPDVAALVMACLAKEPGQRPQSARAVAAGVGLELGSKPSLRALTEEVFSEPPLQEPAADVSGRGNVFAGASKTFLWVGGIILCLLLLGDGWFWRTHLTVAQPRTGPPVAGTKVDLAAMRYGLFIHWGLLTFTGDTYRAERTKNIGQISPARFAPTGFNPRQWAHVAKDTGMDFAMLNAKFEDGFALWPSKCSDYTVANSPFKTDVVAEFIAACNAERVVPGVFYSLIDAHNEGEFRSKGHVGPPFFAVIKKQIVELLTSYPAIRILALDCATKLSKSQFDDVCGTVKQLNSQCLILGDQQPPLGQNFGYDTVIKSWFWWTNAALTPTKQIFDKYSKARAQGRPFLLSVGPDQAGRIPENQIAALMEMRKWIEGGNGPAASSSDLKRGLVLYYSFDEPAKDGVVRDQSGLGNDGQVVGAKWTEAGKRGGGYIFFGTNGCIRVPNNPSLNPPQITLAAWIKTSNTDGVWRSIIDKDWRTTYTLGMVGDWERWKPPGKYRGRVCIGLDNRSNEMYLDTDQPAADGRWHHALATYDGNTERLFLDGRAQKRAVSRAGVLGRNNDDLFIGGFINPHPEDGKTNQFFDGTIDEVMIFNRALSEDEIRQLYESP